MIRSWYLQNSRFAVARWCTFDDGLPDGCRRIPEDFSDGRRNVPLIGQHKVLQWRAERIGTAAVVTRRIGALRARQVSQFSAATAAISEAIEQVGADSSTMTRRPVFCTERRIVSASSGTRVRGSITSTETPSAASASAAARARWTM
jgi:hypothetical protein